MRHNVQGLFFPMETGFLLAKNQRLVFLLAKKPAGAAPPADGTVGHCVSLMICLVHRLAGAKKPVFVLRWFLWFYCWFPTD